MNVCIVVLFLLVTSWLPAAACESYHAVQDAEGNNVPGRAVLNVYQAGTNTKATIYSDPACTTVKTNPVAKSGADWSFYAKDGVYDLTFQLNTIRFATFYGVSLFNSEFSLVNVKGSPYNALCDGVTDDTVAIQAAVTYAHNVDGNDTYVYLPPGVCLTTASIDNFHDVRWFGPGAIGRGSNFFYPDARWGYENHLYIDDSGDNTNDGLSASEPRLTLQSMGDVIYNYAYGDVVWIIHLAAGTYNGGTSFSKPFPTPNRVQFLGPTVSAGVQPTAIIQPSGSESQGIYFQNYVRAQVSNINFKSFRSGASPDANLLDSGIVVDAKSELYAVNVWTDDCDQGIYVTNGSQVRIQSGRHGYNSPNGVGIQFIRQSHGTVGYNGSAASATGDTGVAFIGGTYGMLLQEFAMAHADFSYFDAQTNAGILLTSSRVHAVSSTFNSCTVGIDARLNSSLGWTTNTFTGCTQDTVLRSGSIYAANTISDALLVTSAGKEVNAVGGSTNSATPVTVYTKSFAAKELQLRGDGFKLRLYGDVTGNANTKTVTVSLGTTAILTATIAAATTDYFIEVECMNVTAASSQKCLTKVLENGVAPTINLNAGVAEDLTAGKNLTVTHQVTDTGDSNRISFLELEIIH